MSKHKTRALALLLALVMVLSALPVTAVAVDEGSAASFVNGLPADGSYGVLYNAEGYVMGADIADGKAPAKAATATTDGKKIQSLPNGTAIVRFIRTGSDYYMTVGGKYMTVKDLDADNKEKLVLTDAVEHGSKWTFVPDQAGKAGYYNIKNAEYRWNGTGEVYLEQYRGQQISPYSYYAKDKNGNDTTALYQFKVASTEADEDGRVGEIMEAGALPVNGGKYVIYNHNAKAVMGQPTGADVAAPALEAAAAILNGDGSIDYENVADGGMIFTVECAAEGGTTYYRFENNGKYLAMPENRTNEQGQVENDETLLMIEEPEADKKGYTQWTLTEISGGYAMYNVAARYRSSKCCVEFFNDVFSGWTFKSATPELFAMNFVPMEDRDEAGYVVNPEVTIQDLVPAIGSDCAVEFEIRDVSEPTQITASYKVDDGSFQTAAHSLEIRKGSFTVPAAALEGGKQLTVRVAVTDALGKRYDDTKTVEILDEPLILSNLPAANSATGEEKRPEIGVTFANVKENPSFEMLLDDEAVPAQVSGSKLSYTPAEDLADGKHSVSVTITRADGKRVSKTWNFFIGEGGETLYFGQIHAHTAEYSDGAGTLEDAYTHAQGVEDMDFLIVTDHSNYFDTTSTATTSSYYKLDSLLKNAAGSTSKWEEARATAREYNERYDDFLCVYGYEMTWSGGPGHTNSFNTYGVVSRNNAELNNKSGYAGMHRYNDLMANADKGLDVDGAEAKTTRDGAEVTGVNATKYIAFDAAGSPVPVVSQFNHPGKTFGNFDNYAGYTTQRDDVLNLIEVGNGEGKVGGSAYFPSYSEYDLCLSMGWHVGPTNNQDNHKGGWGSSNSCRDVILTDDFSEIGLYRALDARRIYATEDQNLQIRYELEAAGVSYKLGDIAPLDEDSQPETVTVKLNVTDPDRNDAIATVEVIGNGGKTLAKREVNDVSFNGEIELSNTDSYYYVRVVEADGQIAVTAPVWVKEAVPVGADLETSASVAVQGEEETVIAKLTNGSESVPLYLHGYQIEAEGRVLADVSGIESVVEPGKTEEIKLPFTPSLTEPAAKKSYSVTVTFQVVYKDKELSYSKTISETSYPPSLVTFIGLDNGHKNFYVSGDYAGSDSSFLQICAQHGIICQYIGEGEMTKENLSKYKAILLTVPRINETTVPPVWTAEELEAIADFAAKGGSILNFSKSDRYDYEELVDGQDSYRYASANISNLVNEAVGAQTRFVRGIVVDNDRKLNEAYRINFNGRELVGDHVFTQGIYPSSNGQYQIYNGTGIVSDPCFRFTDVNRKGWYHSAVDFALEHGIMGGTAADKFEPNATLTREMFVYILWKMAGSPEASVENPFTDVKSTNYSYRAILWAYANSITAGRSPSTFERGGVVTRQEMVTFLSAYVKYKGLERTGSADLSVFPDGDDINRFAVEPMKWALANNLIGGSKEDDGKLYLKAKAGTTRAEAAAVLRKLTEFMGEELPVTAPVTTLIAPYPSTWVASYKANFTGSSYVPDYDNDVIMADKGSFSLITVEQLPGGGFLLCAGATFITTFDLKDGDPANEQYVNYSLVCNILDYLRDGPFTGEITPIEQVHQGQVGQEFTVEGTVTSNASDYDKDTAFFDCIYVQDETRGINCFPVSGYYYIGEQVRVHGGVTYYCGEIELNLSNEYNGSIQVISNDLKEVEPKPVSCAEAMSDDNIGNLMQVSGVITEIHETAGVVDKIYVDDGSGEQAMFFINAYIQKESHALDGIAVGMNIEGIGIGSRDVDEENGGADGQVIVDDPSLYIKRLRVRSREELEIWASELDTAPLEAAIAEAEALDRSLYTEASLAALDEALAAAKTVMADADKDQRTVTEAYNALRAALDGLEEKPVAPADGFTLSTAVSEGSQILIYHPAQKLALADSLNGKKVNGVSVEPVGDKLAPVEGAAVYTVEYAEGDSANFYLKMADGKYLTSAPTGNGMSFEESPNEYSLWYLEVLDGEAGSVVVHSTNAAYNNNKNQALEYYNGFTTYGYKNDKDARFVYQIYVKPAR